MADDLEIRSGLILPGAELFFSASRSGGPGGQHANKTSSRVTLTWDLLGSVALTDAQKQRLKSRIGSRLTQDGVLQIHVEEFRSQIRNKELARERLREVIINGLRVDKRRVPTRAGKNARKRRMDGKKARGAVKKLRRKPSGD